MHCILFTDVCEAILIFSKKRTGLGPHPPRNQTAKTAAKHNSCKFLCQEFCNPDTILQATLKDGGVPVQVFWPDGAERELTFLYSTCGCPVKVMAKRTGDRTLRTKDRSDHRDGILLDAPH